MSKIIIGIALFIIVGCGSQKKFQNNINYEQGIVYILPYNVIRELSIGMKENVNVFFILDTNLRNDEYVIYKFDYVSPDEWLKNTNRYIAIEDKLFPLLLRSDYTFANVENAKEYLKNYEPGVVTRTSKYPILENIYRIRFKEDGTILSN